MSATTKRSVAPKEVTRTRETRSERCAGPAAQRSDMLISLLLRVICLAIVNDAVCDPAHTTGGKCAENQREGAIRPPSRRHAGRSAAAAAAALSLVELVEHRRERRPGRPEQQRLHRLHRRRQRD